MWHDRQRTGEGSHGAGGTRAAGVGASGRARGGEPPPLPPHLLGLGLSGPVIADLLASATPAVAQGTPGGQPAFTPTRRGGGGKLRLLSWVAPTMLNPYLATTDTNWWASRVVYEPLISVNPEAAFIPILAAGIPSVDNGGRAPDGTWVIWRLKPGVVWHDGTPFTADDVVFT
jgi:peptide/nickel transport system substrate-binding protein